MRKFACIPSTVVSSGLWANLTGSAKGALIVLWMHADDDRLAWPSLPTIAEFAGVNRTSAVRAIDELEAAGLAKREQVGGGRSRSTRYRLIVPVNSRAHDTDSEDKQAHQRDGISGETVAHARRNEGANSRAHETVSSEKPSRQCTETVAPMHINRRASATRRRAGRRAGRDTSAGALVPANGHTANGQAKPERKPTARGELFAALAAEFYEGGIVPEKQRANVGDVARQLLEMGAKPDEVTRRRRVLIAQWGGHRAKATMRALVNNWAAAKPDDDAGDLLETSPCSLAEADELLMRASA